MTILTSGGNIMDRKRNKRVIITIALIGAFLMIGTGIKTAHAGNLADSAMYATMSGGSQGLGEAYTGFGMYTGDNAYYASAYESMALAYEYAYYAYAYATYASGDYATYAYTYAAEAYTYLESAVTYAYYAYYYNDASYASLSTIYGGFGAYYIAFSEFYAAIGSYGGSY
jgi:hypothetical protein